MKDVGGKAERKKPLGRTKCRWVGKIKTSLMEIRWGCEIGMIWFRIGKSRGFF
jgi:hypothetical protein